MIMQYKNVSFSFILYEEFSILSSFKYSCETFSFQNFGVFHFFLWGYWLAAKKESHLDYFLPVSLYVFVLFFITIHISLQATAARVIRLVASRQ